MDMHFDRVKTMSNSKIIGSINLYHTFKFKERINLVITEKSKKDFGLIFDIYILVRLSNFSNF